MKHTCKSHHMPADYQVLLIFLRQDNLTMSSEAKNAGGLIPSLHHHQSIKFTT